MIFAEDWACAAFFFCYRLHTHFRNTLNSQYLDFLFDVFVRIIENHAMVLRLVRSAEQGHHVKADRMRPRGGTTMESASFGMTAQSVAASSSGHAYIFTGTEDADVFRDM